MNIIERLLDRHFEYRLIHDGCEAQHEDRPVYMKRWFFVKNATQDQDAGIVKPPGHNLTATRKQGEDGKQYFLHKFLRSDADRELHDHPWPFKAVILWRGYYEETENFFEVDMFSGSPFHCKHGTHLYLAGGCSVCSPADLPNRSTKPPPKRRGIRVPACELNFAPDILASLKLTRLRRKWPGMILKRPADHRHRVQLIDGKPSWSFFICGTKARSWGFWRNGVMIPWKLFTTKKCEEQAKATLT